MTLTLLLDLDDTLLGNDMPTFLPVYIQALAEHLSPYIPPGRLTGELLTATREMLANNRPEKTLKEVFEAVFFSALELSRETRVEVQRAMVDFYNQVFPELHHLTEPYPPAVELVKAAFDRGYRVGIATSPAFPRPAVLHRLNWAGLSPEKYPFALISTYESFHFAKPNTAYFAEFLAQMGWPEGPIVMVGDDPHNDIAPARCLELATFWVTRQPERFVPNTPPPFARGDLDQVLPWIDQHEDRELTPRFTTPPALTAILRATPAAIATLLAPLPTERWPQRPSPDDWSLTEVVCHLRDVEQEVHLPRIQKVLREDNPFLPGQDTDAWAEDRRYCDQSGSQAWQDFTAARLQTLDLLDDLATQGWQRPARHTIFGPTDLEELVRIIAGHDQLHVRQIKQTLGVVA